ncbi:MAG: SDR family oxidoreductase [Oscillospiraceae bacterium]|jgi:3-oxoacyl-[acyl-carrier protein] reductase|nr:SDR family oxidoreductase [Oscillospiraceae bacterium]
MQNVALITGASGTLGAATAHALAAEGCHLALHYHANRSAAEALAAELSLAHPTGIFVPLAADLREADQADRLFSQAEAHFSRGIDVLVASAGIALPQQLLQDTTPAQFDALFALDVRAVYLCCRRALPAMLRQKYGRIVTISSVWGVCGGSCEVAYSAAKAAVIGLTKALAKEAGPSGVTCNCVAPGWIESPMNAHLSPAEQAAFAQGTAVGRLGRPAEVAAAVRYFAGEDAGYTTGQVLAVDGGM